MEPFPGGERGDQDKTNRRHPSKETLDNPQQEEDMKTGGESHDKDHDAIEQHPCFIEELRTKPRGKPSPKGSSEGCHDVGRTDDHSRPDHGLFRPKSTDFKDIEGDKCQYAIERKGDTKLGDCDEKNAFIFNSERHLFSKKPA